MSPSPETRTRIPTLVVLDGLLSRMSARLAARLPAMAGYSPTQVASRATQRFAQLLEPAFVNAHQGAGVPQAGSLAIEGAVLDLATGAISLAAAQAARLYGDFLARWLYVAFRLLASVRWRSRHARATLIFGVGLSDIFRGGSDRAFLEYCRLGPIAPLREARHLVVQAVARPGSASDAGATYARSPLHALCRLTGLAPLEAARALAAHFGALLRLTWSCAGSPELLLAARDFAEDALADALNRAGTIEAIVLTTSNYNAQPLWMWAGPGRAFRVHMLWYSQNIRPLVRKTDPYFPVNPVNRLIHVDVMWVWNTPFGDYLSSIGIHAEMRCAGPILWALPPSPPPAPSREPLIAVFDVVPTTEAEDLRLGFVGQFYTPANARRFLADIVSAAGGKARIELKHKRRERDRRDPGYFQYVDELAGRHDNFSVLPAETSIHDMILRCDVAIAMPCSSPVYAASHLGKPSIIYDPTGELVPVFDPAPGLEYVAGTQALAAAVARILGQRHPRQPGAGT